MANNGITRTRRCFEVLEEMAQAAGIDVSERHNGHHTDPIKRAPSFAAHNLTDLGNTRRLVDQHGPHLRYCYNWGRWLVWDGRRWEIDECGEIMRRAKDTVRSIYAEASQLADDDQRKETARWAMRSESEAKIRSMVSLAESEPGIPIRPEDLDTDPWMLNVRNGTVDLRTGQILPHDPGRLITKLCPVEYDPSATCPTWLAFLDRIMDHNQDLLDFMQRAIGYSLTAITSEQVLFFLYGIGANGKSTLLNAIREMMGEDYAQHTPTETLLLKERGRNPQ